jgi:hypothetical protein
MQAFGKVPGASSSTEERLARDATAATGGPTTMAHLSADEHGRFQASINAAERDPYHKSQALENNK